MGSLLVRGWILASLFMQTGLAATVSVEPAVIVTPTPVAKHHYNPHHHWTHIPRPLHSRGPCRAVSSSAIPSSIAISSSSAALDSSSVIASSSPVSTPHSRPVHSHSTSPALASVPATQSSTAIAETSPVPSVTGSTPKGTTTGLGSSPSQLGTSVATSDGISTDAASASVSASASASAGSGDTQSSIPSGSSTLELTTSTVLSTRTATITACPTTVLNCPASAKTTFVTTETIVVSTTICPVTEAAGATHTGAVSPSKTESAGDYGYGSDASNGSESTTSTVYSTRTATITACPSSVTNCPLRSKTTYLTTETLLVSTTICPVADATGVNGAVATNPAGLASTTVYSVAVTQTALPVEVTNVATAAAINQASDDTSASKSGSETDATNTTTIAVESCSDDGTCTRYTNTIVMTQTGTSISTAAPFFYTPHRVSGAGIAHTISASSASSWPQTSQSSDMVTATVSSTTGAVSPAYTGAASSLAGWSMLQVVSPVMMILAAIVV